MFVRRCLTHSTSLQTFQLFSHSVVSDSLRPHESQHARPPCPSPTPGVYSNSCPSSQRCHLAISSSVVPFSSSPQSLPASGSFPMRQLKRWPKYWKLSFSISPLGLFKFYMYTIYIRCVYTYYTLYIYSYKFYIYKILYT